MQAHEDVGITQQLTINKVVTAIALYFVIGIAVSFWTAPKYPTTVPWAGHGKGWIASIRNTFGSFTNSKNWFVEGYSKYSRNDRTFVMPSGVGSVAETVIPRSQIRWFLDQSDDVLSTCAAHYETMHGAYSFVKPVIMKDPYHSHVMRKQLARNLNAVIPEIDEEICHDVEEFFGENVDDWKSINVMDFWMKLIPRVINRMLVGESLCRNQSFLDNMLGFANDWVRGVFILALCPRLLHPIVGGLHSLSGKYHWWRTSKLSLPLIKQRLHDINRKDAGDPEYKSWKEPNDYVSWTIRTAKAEGRSDELDPTRISIRLMPINFAGLHTTALTGQAALLDILSADPSVLESIREEAAKVYEEEGGRWTKAGLARMYRMDSAIRESQRCNTIGLTFIHRKVVAKEGIVSPEGVHFGYGTIVSCPWNGISADEELHENPDEYDAFRYSRDREAHEEKSREERGKDETLKLRQQGLVTTSDKHLAFGHGRNACPGRFFVSHELKMVFARLFLNYDIKHLPERPRPFWFGRTFVPPTDACIEVKRRRVDA